jgi:AraC family transcriptional regulator
MKKKAVTYYADKISRVCDYIDTRLDEDLSLEELSRVACFSKYHFHRQFSGYMGVNVQKFIQLMRLKRASYELVFTPNRQIIEIALDAQFENPESFSRAFKKIFGQTPSQFRKAPDWPAWHEKYRFPKPTGEHIMEIKVKVVEFKKAKVAVLEHRGSHERLNDSVAQFIKWRKETQLSPVETSNTYGIAYDDPATTLPEQFRFDICGEVKQNIPVNSYGVINKEIPNGDCAVIRHLGSRDHMEEKIYYLYREWLPGSGRELRDFPLFFHYINLFPKVPESKLITDIYLPLK